MGRPLTGQAPCVQSSALGVLRVLPAFSGSTLRLGPPASTRVALAVRRTPRTSSAASLPDRCFPRISPPPASIVCGHKLRAMGNCRSTGAKGPSTAKRPDGVTTVQILRGNAMPNMDVGRCGGGTLLGGSNAGGCVVVT